MTELDTLPQQVAVLGPRYPVLVAIIEASALAFGLQPTDLLSDYRGKSVVEARMVACFVARRCTRMSFPQIGKAFGRDHTTVMSACQRVETLRQRDEWLRAAVTVLLERFGENQEATQQ
jgi:chromosomal replication initiation ATPase DnaA